MIVKIENIDDMIVKIQNDNEIMQNVFYNRHNTLFRK